MNVGEQLKTKERKKYIFKYLRRGKLPKQVIEMVMEEYGLGEDMAEKLVYECNHKLKEDLKDLSDNAAEYLMNNVQALADSCIEKDDRKTALKSYELLAKICKVGADDNKMDISVNFGFDFTNKDDDSRN